MHGQWWELNSPRLCGSRHKLLDKTRKLGSLILCECGKKVFDARDGSPVLLLAKALALWGDADDDATPVIGIDLPLDESLALECLKRVRDTCGGHIETLGKVRR